MWDTYIQPPSYIAGNIYSKRTDVLLKGTSSPTMQKVWGGSAAGAPLPVVMVKAAGEQRRVGVRVKVEGGGEGERSLWISSRY